MPRSSLPVSGEAGRDRSRPTTMAAAVDYARHGWSVIPLVAGEKRPTVPWRPYQHEIASMNEIAGWFRRCPDASLGISGRGCGKLRATTRSPPWPAICSGMRRGLSLGTGDDVEECRGGADPWTPTTRRSPTCCTSRCSSDDKLGRRGKLSPAQWRGSSLGGRLSGRGPRLQ